MLRAILQLLREFLETLAGYNGEPIDQRIETSLAAFAHRQTQAPSDGLPPLAFRADLAQRANLENIRVVPTLAQSRVAEDESQWLGDRKQPLLVTHDQIVSVVIRLGGAPFTAVFRFAFLLGEIAIVNFLYRQRIQRRVARQFGKLLIQLHKPLPEFPVGLRVVRHAIHEEQRQDFHPLILWKLRDAYLLFKMLSDRLPHLDFQNLIRRESGHVTSGKRWRAVLASYR